MRLTVNNLWESSVMVRPFSVAWLMEVLRSVDEQMSGIGQRGARGTTVRRCAYWYDCRYQYWKYALLMVFLMADLMLWVWQTAIGRVG